MVDVLARSGIACGHANETNTMPKLYATFARAYARAGSKARKNHLKTRWLKVYYSIHHHTNTPHHKP